MFAFHHRLDAIGDLVLLGSADPLDFGRVLAAIGGDDAATTSLHRLGFDQPEAFLRGLIASPETVEHFVAGAPLNSDDRPRVELRAPLAIFRNASPLPNLLAFLQAAEDVRLPVATLPDAAVDPVLHARSLVLPAPDGFRLSATGYRVATLPAAPNAIPRREILRELVFEDGGGRLIDVVSAAGVRDRAGLDRLAVQVAGASVAASGDTAVGGHPAVAYRVAPREGDAVAWTCPETGTSHAAVFLPGGRRNGTGIADWLRDSHCHS